MILQTPTLSFSRDELKVKTNEVFTSYSVCVFIRLCNRLFVWLCETCLDWLESSQGSAISGVLIKILWERHSTYKLWLKMPKTDSLKCHLVFSINLKGHSSDFTHKWHSTKSCYVYCGSGGSLLKSIKYYFLTQLGHETWIWKLWAFRRQEGI